MRMPLRAAFASLRLRIRQTRAIKNVLLLRWIVLLNEIKNGAENWNHQKKHALAYTSQI